MPQPRRGKKQERGDYGWVISFGCKNRRRAEAAEGRHRPGQRHQPDRGPLPCGETHRVTVSPYRRRRAADEPFDLEVTSLDELRSTDAAVRARAQTL